MVRISLFLFACAAGLTVARAELDPEGFHQFLRNRFVSEPLRWNAIQNEHLVAGEINGEPAGFHIDSGAARSTLTLRTVRRLGLEVTDTGRTQPGIGGVETVFSATVDSLRVGRSIRTGRQPMLVLDMPRTLASDGLIGGDVLSAIGAVIDHRDHLLLVRHDGTPSVDLAPEAKLRGMVCVPLEREANYHFLTLGFRDENLRFILDTGSQQSLIDSGTAERLKLPLVDTDVRAAGVGSQSRRTRLATLDRLDLCGITLRKTPMLVIPVDAFGETSERKFDGILGAEFLFASGAVFDAGNRRLFLPPGDLDLRPYAKTGSEMLGSDKELAALYQDSSWVGGVKVIRFTLESDESRKASPDPHHTAARLELEIVDTIKGTAPHPSGSPFTLAILLPHRDDLREWATGVFGRNPRKILFLPADASSSPPLWEKALFTDGEIPREQLRTIAETVKPKAVSGPKHP